MSVHSTTKPNAPALYEQKKRSVPVRYGVPRSDESEATRQAADYAARRNRRQPISDEPEPTDAKLSSAYKQAITFTEKRNRKHKG